MSEFNDRVRDSQSLSKLKNALAILAELKSREWEHQRASDLIERLEVVAKNIYQRLTVADRGLVAGETLNGIEKPSRRFLDAIQDIANLSLSDEPDYDSASNCADNLLVSASSLPVLPIRTTSEVLGRASEQFDREAQSSTALLLERLESIRSETDGTRNQLEADWTNFQKSVSEFESRVSGRVAQVENETASIASEMRRTSESLLSQTRDSAERLEREVTSIQENFRSSEQERANQFIASQNSRGEAQASRDEEYREWFEENQSEVAGLQKEAETMLEEVAGASTAEHYMKLRSEQNRTANFWRWVTLGSFIFLIAASAYIYFDIQAIESLSVATVIARYGVAFPLLALATYALRQSGHHRKREEDTARVSHELMLLWPFMNRLSEEERQAQLKIITPLYFKGGLTPQDAGDKIGFLGHIPGFGTDRNRSQRPE